VAALSEIKPDFKPKATLPKVDAKDLQLSSRSPVIPVVKDSEKSKKLRKDIENLVYDPTSDRKGTPKKKLETEKKSVSNEDRGELIPKEAPQEIEQPKATEKKKEPEKPATTPPTEKKDKRILKSVKPASKKEITFPVESFVNEYRFLQVPKKVLEKIGWSEKLDKRRTKKVMVTLDFQDGALVVKKRSA
jgi:hypothetical protein